MKKDEFIHRMKKEKKTPTTIKRYIEFKEVFERYLKSCRKGKIEEAGPEDLEEFKIWGEKNRLKNLRLHFMSIATYYKYMNKKQMVLKSNEMMGLIDLENYTISAFHGINRKIIEKLNQKGIKSARQLLETGSTEEERHRLSKTAKVPADSILELVKLSNLARIPGVKKIRARLYYDAGLDTLDKIARCDAELLRKTTGEFIKKSGFKGIPPTPKEAEHTVAMAKYLEKNVRF